MNLSILEKWWEKHLPPWLHLTPTLGHLHEDAHMYWQQWTPALTACTPRARGVQYLGQSPRGQRAAPGEHPVSRLRPRHRGSWLRATTQRRPRERILESQRQTWNSISDLLLTASRDCGRKRWSINTYPLASANTTAERRGLLDFERWTQPSSNFNNYWELSMCQALCRALSTWVTVLLEPATNGSMIPILQMRTLRQENLSNLPQFIQTPNGRAAFLNSNLGCNSREICQAEFCQRALNLRSEEQFKSKLYYLQTCALGQDYLMRLDFRLYL